MEYNILTRSEFAKKVSSLFIIFKSLPIQLQKIFIGSLNNNNFKHVFSHSNIFLNKFDVTYDNHYFYYTIEYQKKTKHIILDARSLVSISKNLRQLKLKHLNKYN